MKLPALAKREEDDFLGRPLYDLSQYKGAHSPRTDGTLNVADSINAGNTVMPWLSSSGAGPGTEGYRGGGHFSSDRDGSTTAPVSPHAFGGLDEFYQNQRNLEAERFQPVAQPQPLPSFPKPAPPKRIDPLTGRALPELADGAGVPGAKHPPLPLLQPFIAGDPQKDGKPNPELIIPGMHGTQAVPLKNIPKMASGGRVDGRQIPTLPVPKQLRGLDEFYHNNPGTPDAAHAEAMKLMLHPKLPMPIRIPKLAYGTSVERSTVPGQEDMLILKDNPYGTGFSTGALPTLPQLPQAQGVPHGTIPAPLPTFGNPDGIQVGVTPREALHGFADQDAARKAFAQATGEDRKYARLDRNLLRAAQGNPQIAMQLVGGKAAAAAAAAKEAGVNARHQSTQKHLDQRSQAVIEATNARAEATRKAQEDARVVAWQQEQYKQNYGEYLKQLEEQRKQEAAGQSFPITDPTTGRTDPNHFRTGTNVILPTSATKPITQTFPGSGVYINPELGSQAGKATMTAPAMPGVPSLNIPWMGQTPAVPPSPAQFKQVAEVKKTATQARMDLIKRMTELDKLEMQATGNDAKAQIKKMRTDLLADLNNNGVPDALEEGGAQPAPGPVAAPAPDPATRAAAASSFLDRIKKKS